MITGGDRSIERAVASTFPSDAFCLIVCVFTANMLPLKDVLIFSAGHDRALSFLAGLRRRLGYTKAASKLDEGYSKNGVARGFPRRSWCQAWHEPSLEVWLPSHCCVLAKL